MRALEKKHSLYITFNTVIKNLFSWFPNDVQTFGQLSPKL